MHQRWRTILLPTIRQTNDELESPQYHHSRNNFQYSFQLHQFHLNFCGTQCFDTVGWACKNWVTRCWCGICLHNHASTPPLSFLQAGCPSCRLTNSAKALKAIQLMPLHPKAHHLLPRLNPDRFYISIPAYPGCPEKEVDKRGVVVVLGERKKHFPL